MCHALFNVALLALSASYCKRAVLARAACAHVRLGKVQVPVRSSPSSWSVGASTLSCHSRIPLPPPGVLHHHICFHAFVRVRRLAMLLCGFGAPSPASCKALAQYVVVACTAARFIIFVAMLLCGFGATRPARCRALAQYVFVACTAARIIIFVAMLLCGSGAPRPACCKALAQYVVVACTASRFIIFVAMLLSGSGATRPARCKALAQYVFVVCTAACIIIFVAMLLCGSGAIALPATKY